jgi:hypothetical protein
VSVFLLLARGNFYKRRRKILKELFLMGEINEALGIGDVFVIDGAEYHAHIATFEELETIEKKTEGLYLQSQGMRFNFMKLTDEEDNKARDARVKKLLALLQMIFPDCPAASLKKMDRKVMAASIATFLFD